MTDSRSHPDNCECRDRSVGADCYAKGWRWCDTCDDYSDERCDGCGECDGSDVHHYDDGNWCSGCYADNERKKAVPRLDAVI